MLIIQRVVDIFRPVTFRSSGGVAAHYMVKARRGAQGHASDADERLVKEAKARVRAENLFLRLFEQSTRYWHAKVPDHARSIVRSVQMTQMFTHCRWQIQKWFWDHLVKQAILEA